MNNGFTFKELIKAYEQIDSFNETYKGRYRMSCHSDSKGLHLTVIDFECKQVLAWQPVHDNDELHDFIINTNW